MTSPTFLQLGVAEPLLRALTADNYTQPTPIQAKAIPYLLQGRDLLGIAETGTGKTAAFALPILQGLAESPERPVAKSPRALILAPTRELAGQIGDSFKSYGRNLKLTHTVIFGGVGQGPQVKAMVHGVDILIATPGRLMDLMQQGFVRLDRVQCLVLDEADRMLDMGFVRDVRKIVAKTPKDRQSLLFSATMPGDIAKLAAEILKDPVRVEIATAGKTVDRVDQRVYFVNATAKRDLLGDLLSDAALSRVIVFTRTKSGANRVSQFLERIGVNADAIHGNKSQGARQKALASFKAGHTRVLVATDIAARGLDIDLVTHVINYELPNEPESYVHRIGRTARAGTDGIAIAFCSADERTYLRDIERLTRVRLTVVDTPAMEPGRYAGPAEDKAQRREAAGDRGERRPGGGGRGQSRGGANGGGRGQDSQRSSSRAPNRDQRSNGASHGSERGAPSASVDSAAPWSNWTGGSRSDAGAANAAPAQVRREEPRTGAGAAKSRNRRRGARGGDRQSAA